MTPALPLPAHDGENTQAIFDLIAKSAIDTGARSIKLRWGSQALTWPGGVAGSNASTITHGVGSAPVAVLATVGDVSGLNANPAVRVNTVGATTFRIDCGTVDAQNPLNTATTTVYWLALG